MVGERIGLPRIQPSVAFGPAKDDGGHLTAGGIVTLTLADGQKLEFPFEDATSRVDALARIRQSVTSAATQLADAVRQFDPNVPAE